MVTAPALLTPVNASSPDGVSPVGVREDVMGEGCEVVVDEWLAGAWVVDLAVGGFTAGDVGEVVDDVVVGLVVFDGVPPGVVLVGHGLASRVGVATTTYHEPLTFCSTRTVAGRGSVLSWPTFATLTSVVLWPLMVTRHVTTGAVVVSYQ
jgi:hypothetical protein